MNVASYLKKTLISVCGCIVLHMNAILVRGNICSAV